MEPDVASAPPSLKKDNTGEVLCDRPRRRSPEAVVVHGIGMPLKQLTIRGTVVIPSPTPEFIIRCLGIIGPHNCIMSGKPELVPVGAMETEVSAPGLVGPSQSVHLNGLHGSEGSQEPPPCREAICDLLVPSRS
jgi:hypothetical protein